MSKPKISEAAYERLASWKGELPVATLMGEFSAGKSTLLNFLLGFDAAPTKVTATHMPPTWFTFSETPNARGITWNGDEEEIDLDRGETDLRDRYLLVRRGLQSDILKDCDLIDAPGISDPGLHKDALRFLTRYTDFVVWCTAANQAWRQTENAAYGKLSQAVKDRSILVVTRMDKLRSPKDQAKVLKRVNTDAGPLFQCVLPLQTPKAAAVSSDMRTDEPTGPWVKTGGRDFFEAFSETCASTKPKSSKSRRKVTESSPPASKPANQKLATKKPEASKELTPSKTTTSRKIDLVGAFTSALNQFQTMPENSQHCIQIDHLIASIPCELEKARPDNATLHECLQIEHHDLDIERFLSQIKRELRAFGDRDRVLLDARRNTSVTRR